MSYISPPPEWMPGKEALDHIREAAGCSASDAIKQLRTSIADGAVSARLPNPKNPRRNAIFPPWADTLIANHGGPGASASCLPWSTNANASSQPKNSASRSRRLIKLSPSSVSEGRKPASHHYIRIGTSNHIRNRLIANGCSRRL